MIRGTSGPDDPNEIPGIRPLQSGQAKKPQNKKSQPLPPQGEDEFISGPVQESTAATSSTVTTNIEGLASFIKNKLFKKISPEGAELLAQMTYENLKKKKGTEDIV